MDITQLILDDHAEQRRLFGMIEQLGSNEPENLEALWGRLSAFLEVHAKAEETFFYTELMRVGQGVGKHDGPEDETKDAIKDHNEIRNAIAAVEKFETGTKEWFDAIGKVNKANGDHMAEEEREGLTDFRRTAKLQLRHDLAVKFSVFEARHITGVNPKNLDPAAYVAENEKAATAKG